MGGAFAAGGSVSARIAGVIFLLIAFSFGVTATAQANGGQTLYVNKYSPNASSTPGCATAPYTEIGSDSPSPSGAVGDASSGDTIFICGSPNADSDPYEPNGGIAGVPVGAKNLTFVGDGPELTIIDGEGNRTPFYAFDPGSYLNFSSLTVRGGADAVNGGGAEAPGRSVTLTNVAFTDNYATFGVGGAISAGEVHANDSTFDSNRAMNGDGGAIFGGEVTVSDSTFQGNSTQKVPGWPRHKGGAIYSEGSVTIEDSEFLGNSADGQGGAVFALGAGADPGLIEIIDSTFSGNTTDTGSGGATYAEGPTTLSGTEFRGNVAGTVSVAEGTGDGGAIWAREQVTATGSSFIDNAAPGYQRSGVGGAIASVTGISTSGSTFDGNSAADFGGALSAGAGVTVEASTFDSNRVTDPNAYGGAIYAEFGGPGASTITDSTFTGNSANANGSFGGAVHRVGSLVISNSTFTGNEAFSVPAVASDNSTLQLNSVTSSGNIGPYVWTSLGSLTISGSIIDETGEACRAPFRYNMGGNVIAATAASDCDAYLGGAAAPPTKVSRSSIALLPPADNGGPTETMALGLGSIARASSDNCRQFDQRGLGRPLTGCSSGAYQLTTESLTVSKAGNGSGTVTSSPTGISCGPDCPSQSQPFAQNPPFTTVTLRADGAPGSRFAGWSGGGCTGTGTCQVGLNEAKNVTAFFTTINYGVLAVSKPGTGSGRVVSQPAGIDCGDTCAAIYERYSTVRLTATPEAGSAFSGWGGPCSGSGPTCEVSFSDSTVVTAEFTSTESRRLTVTKGGSGQGTVSSSPSGIDCGSSCEGSFGKGQVVTLTASPAEDSTFAGWSGACTNQGGTCEVTMGQAQQVTADFQELPQSDVAFEPIASRPTKVPGSGIVRAVRVSCEGEVFCRIVGGRATARARGGEEQAARVSYPSGDIPAGGSRVVSVTIPFSVHERLRRKKSGQLSVTVRAEGTKGVREATYSVGLRR